MSPRPSTPTHTIRALTGATALFAAGLFVPALAHAQGDHVMGSVSSVSGNTFEVARSSGTTTVSLTDETRIFESVPAQRGEITAGTCIKAGAAPDSAPADSGAITAKFVAISTTVDGKCPQRPAAAADAPAPPKPHRGVRGVVESVSGDTLTISGPSGPTTVTLNDSTHFRRMVAVSAPSISAGKCVAAGGTKDGDGVLQARRVTVWAGDGNCPEPPA
ncbi:MULTISPECIES: DUF5666 domain-containing protein [Mycolicibacter]|uniref:DUF5666 domain-containing protein n=1 Tax=Mycolicibacter virginiensis TaxID=1795032 RepID=A0A9X7IKM1_9MYCO|nr:MULTISPECIES: DUF5666 domain-containing protein [Mycolicibacter]OBG35733.1 hypothetical protein A5671_00025 [Mycolicibacter heraklionensis]OBJ28822.1 hypothetical protein A5631_19580 [Mycolicibacter heraklionensis]PQM50882.1 hypothetical protein C5U48_17825 [Mycolicibacter virginiensis]